MSYHPTARTAPVYRMRARRARKPAAALGGVLDDITSLISPVSSSRPPSTWMLDLVQNNAQVVSCIGLANTQTAPLDAAWYKVAQQWNPVGNFNVSDMQNALNVVFQMIGAAWATLLAASVNASTGDLPSEIAQAESDLTDVQNTGGQYQQAVTNATAQGYAVVNAPNFKDWVLRAMLATSGAYAVSAVNACDKNWVDTAQSALNTVASTVIAIADAVVAAADAVYDAGKDVVNVLSYAKWIALGLGALWLYKTYRK